MEEITEEEYANMIKEEFENETFESLIGISEEELKDLPFLWEDEIGDIVM